MLRIEPYSFGDCVQIWSVDAVERLEELRQFVLQESRKGDQSPWVNSAIPRSYLASGYCAAALRSLRNFLPEYRHRQRLLRVFEDHSGDEADLASKLDVEMDLSKWRIEDLPEGKEAVRQHKARINQDAFRDIIMELYDNTCCITGLNIPAINRASHIVGWAEDKSIRMDPRNGLCLSATYDAAFDKKLISLDDDYRILVSREITDHYTRECVREHFQRRQGERIRPPVRYRPSRDYLNRHRASGQF